MINADDGRICDECNDFYTLSPSGEECISCQDAYSGCLKCTSASNGQVDECTECVSNLALAGGECTFDLCESWDTSDDDGAYLYSAQCTDCRDYYGLHSSGVCVECSIEGELWDNCVDCSVDDNLSPFDCLACDSPSQFDYIENPDTTPFHTCQAHLSEEGDGSDDGPVDDAPVDGGDDTEPTYAPITYCDVQVED